MAWNEPGNNNRDPWNQGSGGKRGDLPPNLNELIRRLRARFGGKGPNGSMILLLAVGLLLVWLLSGFYQVDEQEQAVVLRFGAYVGTVGPGLHWHLPPPLEHKKNINVTNPRQTSVQAELLTKDLNLVDVALTVQFRVSSVQDNLFSVHQPDDALRQAAASALQEVVAGYAVDDVIRVGAQAVIAENTKQRLQQLVDGYHCGLLVTDASLKVNPPEAVTAAFADAYKADDEQKSRRNDAQAYAADRLPKARAEAARKVGEATAYREQAIARAEGDAARFTALLQEYRKSPQVTRKRLYLETMSEIYAGAGKVLLQTGSGTNLNLPLEQLLGGAAAPANAPAEPRSGGDGAAPAAPPRSSAVPGAGSGNSDDSSRSRDRESH